VAEGELVITVWVVEVGEYSDCRIHAVYDNEEAALLEAARLLDLKPPHWYASSVAVTPYALNDKRYPSPVRYWMVWGTWHDHPARQEFAAESADDVPLATHAVLPPDGGYVRDRVFARGVGRTLEQAEKSYHDHYAQGRAEMEGIA
jgi:hypothetical protein